MLLVAALAGVMIRRQAEPLYRGRPALVAHKGESLERGAMPTKITDTTVTLTGDFSDLSDDILEATKAAEAAFATIAKAVEGPNPSELESSVKALVCYPSSAVLSKLEDSNHLSECLA